MMIFCKKCQTEREDSDFYIRAGKVIYPCLVCKREYAANWKKLNSDYHKRWRESNKDKIYANIKRYRQRKKAKENLGDV